MRADHLPESAEVVEEHQPLGQMVCSSGPLGRRDDDRDGIGAARSERESCHVSGARLPMCPPQR